jgi:hypothetical protein
MKEEASVAWEVQYRNNEADPWQLLCDRDETEAAAERRIAGLFLKNPQTRTWFRIVKVTREPQVMK